VIIPETYSNQDWPRKVAQGYRAISAKVKTAEAQAAQAMDSTGWETYVHGGGAQTLVASTRTKLSIDGAAFSNTAQKPTDVAALWDTVTNTITGREGDALLIKIQGTFTPSDATASFVEFDVDIGGSIGIVERENMALTGGAGVTAPFTFSFGGYTLDTWEANGGSIYATADGPGDIDSLRIVVIRVHKAR